MPPRAIFRSERGRRAIEDSYRRLLAESTVPLRAWFAETGQGRTHLIEAGPADGNAVLLLHGSASNSAAWLGDIPVWSREYGPDLVRL